MSFPLIPPKIQFLDNAGNPLNAGTVEFRSPSTNSYIDSYPTADNADSQTNSNSNPVILNSRGEAPAGIFLEDNVSYKVILKDSSGDTIWTIDDIKTPGGLETFLSSTYTPGSTNSVDRTLQSRLDDIVSVKDFGALGDGSTDDTAALQAAINQGGSIYLPDGTYNFTGLTFDVAVVLHGSRNAILNFTDLTASKAIHIKSSNVELRGFCLTSALGNGTYVANHFGIYGNETTYSPVVITYLNDLVVDNVKITNFGQHGIRFDYLQDSSITNNHIQWCGTHGIHLGAGCFDNLIDSNVVEDIKPGVETTGTAPYHPAYGITITRDPARETSEAPTSLRNRITNNRVTGVPSWNGIDSHGSQLTTIKGNLIQLCSICIHMEDGNGPTDKVASSRISIEGNTCIGNAGTSFKVGPGVNLKGSGDSSNLQRSIGITDNLIYNCGWETAGLYSTTHGAIHVLEASGLTITGNTIFAPYGAGIYLDRVDGGVVTGNSVQNVQSSSGDVYGIRIADGDVDCVIENNSLFGATPQINISAGAAPDSGYQFSVGKNNHFGSATEHGTFIGELTIASGVITVTADHHPVDTQSNLPDDDLDTINGGYEGRVVTLYAEDNTHTVVVKDSTGNIELEADFSLDHNHDSITLIYLGTAWRQIGSSNNSV